ncbi:hypothetical protein [Microbacterium sp.]|uniref:hypothetical protein n=1 Tax=Microbacterium sp. TaxID=51671 RepID=UPI003F984452
MAMNLNEAALSHARGLLRRDEFTDDERDDWSEHAPSTDQENEFIDENGLAAFAKWHLGEDTEMGEDTKGRYHFPYGDFRKLHRCAVISGESRAGQYKHESVENALKELLDGIDTKTERDK